ncbi:TMEM175 family protein [Fulvivirga sp.]
MVRQKLKASPLGINPEFKNRGEEQTRIETFSDAVFALAVTLLVLSSTVPTTYDQLLESFVNIIPFGICITLLMMIWFQHYIFFIRYGFKD